VKELSRAKEKAQQTRFQELDGQINETGKDLSKLATLKKQAAAEAARLRGRRAKADSEARSARENLEAAQAELAQLSEKSGVLAARVSECAQDVQTLERRIEAVSLGRADENDPASLLEQIEAEKHRLADLQVNTRRIEQNRPKLTAERTRYQARVRESEADFARLARERDRAEATLAEAQAALSRLPFDPEEYDRLANEHDQLSGRLARVVDKIEKAEQHLSDVTFEYEPPPGFDVKNVHGVFARLIRVPDVSYTTALETAAGGRLYHVVVEDMATSKTLFNKVELKRYIHTIPLDVIRSSKINRDRIASAVRVCGNARLAQDLVEFSPHIEAAVQFVFGQILVCDSLEDAERVAFHKDVHAKCVDRKGDVFDPQGTLSVGRRSKTANVIARLAAFDELKRDESRLRSDIENYVHVMELNGGRGSPTKPHSSMVHHFRR
jgi:structural maintenance of chromosome 2